jgi:hypothetical protein
MGAYNAYRKFFKSWLPADCDVVCVGDGTTPRTAGLFAFLSRDRSRKRFFSIDPILNGERFVLDSNTLQHMEEGNKCPSPGSSVGLRIHNLVCLSKSVYEVTPEGVLVSEDREHVSTRLDSTPAMLIMIMLIPSLTLACLHRHGEICHLFWLLFHACPVLLSSTTLDLAKENEGSTTSVQSEHAPTKGHRSALLVLVHAHVNLEKTVETLTKPGCFDDILGAISLPCCNGDVTRLLSPPHYPPIFNPTTTPE